MESNWGKFVRLTSLYTGVAPGLITPLAVIKDLDLDSMGVLDIMLEYEAEFKVDTDPDSDHTWTEGNVTDLCNFLNAAGANIEIPAVT